MSKLSLLIGLSLGALLLAGSATAQTSKSSSTSKSSAAASKSSATSKFKEPYDGIWGSNPKACRDPDGVNRMTVQESKFYWYETECRARDIKAESGKAWTMRLTCEGEGMKFSAKPRVSLPTPDKLVMEHSPVGGPKDKPQAYVRCDPNKPPRQ